MRIWYKNEPGNVSENRYALCGTHFDVYGLKLYR